MYLGSKENQQLFYRISEEYPSTNNLNSYDVVFEMERWEKCTSNIPEWDYYEDSSD